MKTIHVFIVDPAEEARTAIAVALGDEQPWVAHDSLPQVAQSIDRGYVPAVVLVGPGVVHDDAMMLADSIQDERLPVRLIQFVKVLDPDRLQDAMRAGVADVVEVHADAGEVLAAVTRAQRDLLDHVTAMSATVAESPTVTPVVAVAGGKGGVGSSLVTTNVAMSLADRGLSVGLVDLDVISGDLAIMLQKRPSLSVLDAVDRIDHLDADAVSGYLTPVGERVQLLAAPLEGGEVHVPLTPFMRLLALLQDAVDVVVVDVGQVRDSTARAVLAEARLVLVVTTREVTAVRGTLRVLNDLRAIGLGQESVWLVVNQSDAPTGLSTTDMEKSLSRELAVLVPVDKAATKSVNQGDPLVNRRRSKAGQALTGLATRLIDKLGLVQTD